MNTLSMKQYRMANGPDIDPVARETLCELHAPLQLLGCRGCIDSTTLEFHRDHHEGVAGGSCKKENVITSSSGNFMRPGCAVHVHHDPGGKVRPSYTPDIRPGCMIH